MIVFLGYEIKVGNNCKKIIAGYDQIAYCANQLGFQVSYSDASGLAKLGKF